MSNQHTTMVNLARGLLVALPVAALGLVLAPPAGDGQEPRAAIRGSGHAQAREEARPPREEKLTAPSTQAAAKPTHASFGSSKQVPRAPAAPDSVAALQRLDDSVARHDTASLLDLARKDRSLVRYEALHRFLILEGLEGLDETLALLVSDDDANLHDQLRMAFESGGSAAHAPLLAEVATRAPAGSARLAAAAAICGIAERVAIAPATLAVATEALTTLALTHADLSADACVALATAGATGANALDALAARRDAPDHTRLAAAEALIPLAPDTAQGHLRDLAATANDDEIRSFAALYLGD